MTKSFTLKLIDRKFETEDTVTFFFRQPAIKKVKYLAGQYITVCLTINGRKYRRPYSFSSSPLIDQTLNITIKRVPEGIVSNYMIDRINEGDMIEVLEPMGEFVLPEDVSNQNELFLWAAGSGITPLFSILKTVLNLYPHIKITLINCVRNQQEIIFRNELEEMAQQFKDNFHIFHYFSRPRENTIAENCCFERISRANIKHVLDGLVHVTESIHYICGPSLVKDLVKKELDKVLVQDEKIYTEDFDHVVNEEDLKDIKTESVTLIVKDGVKQVAVNRGVSILEACLDAGLDLPYSCQNGSCTLCKAKIQNGKVKMITDSKPDRDMLDDEYLLCCAYPLDSEVQFIIND